MQERVLLNIQIADFRKCTVGFAQFLERFQSLFQLAMDVGQIYQSALFILRPGKEIQRKSRVLPGLVIVAGKSLMLGQKPINLAKLISMSLACI